MTTVIDKEIQERLKQPLDPKLVKKRKQGGRDVSYLEGHTVISQANDIFGFDGWSYEVMDITRMDAAASRPIWSAKVRVTALGVQRSDIGVNVAANDSPDSQDTAVKGAVTDALKRALRTFGAQFGNDLYDKEALVETAQKMGAKRMCSKHPDAQLTQSKSTKRWGHVLEDGTPCVEEGE